VPYYVANYYPYGDAAGTASQDQVGFATYTQDSYTGLDYADHRMYASTYGRFNTPDPYQASGGPGSPASWNRYSYTRGDPVNRRDPRGLVDIGDGYDNDGGGTVSPTFLSAEDCIDDPEACMVYDSGGSPCNPAIMALQPNPACYNVSVVGFYEEWAPPELCPLIGIVGNYTVTNAWPVYAEFAPALAYDIDEAFATLNAEGVVPQINSGYRSVAAQAGIPANNPNGVAPPGQSWHNVGQAVDIQLNPTTQVGQEIIAAMEGAGLTWGGVFTKLVNGQVVPSPDNVHFQLPGAVAHANGTVTSGAPSAAQVAACQAAHPLGH
jgi:RHS repeat-associated protein